MNNQSASRRPNPEFWAIIAVGVAVLGQAVWLDAKIERVDARLEVRIEGSEARLETKIQDSETRLEARIQRLEIKIGSLQEGQAAIRERLAVVEGYVGRALPDALALVEGEAMPTR